MEMKTKYLFIYPQGMTSSSSCRPPHKSLQQKKKTTLKSADKTHIRFNIRLKHIDYGDNIIVSTLSQHATPTLYINIRHYYPLTTPSIPFPNI